MPSITDQWKKIQKDFLDRWQFPFYCGAIDGKHVLIENPSHGASYYYNYKGTYSVVLFAIVDAHYRFIYIDFGTNGRMNDSYIWKKKQSSIVLLKEIIWNYLIRQFSLVMMLSLRQPI